MNRILKVILGVIIAGISGNVSASVIFSDDFSSSGSGTGFAPASTWSDGTLSGGELSVTGAESFRDFATNITTATMDFWLVSNMKIDGSSTSWGGMNFYDGGTWELFFGSDSGSTAWSFDINPSPDVETTIPAFNAQSRLLIAHITDSTVDMWINPADTNDLGTADASYAGAAGSVSSGEQWTRMRIASGSTATVTVKGVVAATTLAEALIFAEDPDPDPDVTATVYFHDDFSSPGSGTGFAPASSWSTGTLSDGELSVTGTQSFRDFATNILTDDMDFWLVSNMKMDGNSAKWGGYNFYDGVTWDLFFGSDSDSSNWSFDIRGGGDFDTTVTNYIGESTLLVAHITDSTVDMWINPADVSSSNALGTADASYAGAAGSVSSVAQWTRLRIAGDSTVGVTVNDVAVATTLAEALIYVVEPPDPEQPIISTVTAGTENVIQFTTEAGTFVYSLWGTDNLIGPWSNLSNTVVGTGSEMSLTNTPVGSPSEYFYKITVQR